MQIKILCISKLQNKEILNLVNEYVKRLGKFSNIEFIELKKDIKISQIKEKYKNNYFIFLDENGKSYTSSEFSIKIDKLNTYTNSQISFLVGDSDGFSKEDLALADETLSLSKMTLPHELCAVFLIEQVYRAMTILNNHPYHRE